MAELEPQNGISETTLSFASLKPHLLLQAPKANDAVAFYKNAFGAEEVSRTLNPKRKADQELPHVLSAELKIAGSSFIISDLVDDSDSPLETEDIEAAITKAVNAGAVANGEVAEFEGASGGGRVGKVTDPYGYVWQISTPVKNVEA